MQKDLFDQVYPPAKPIQLNPDGISIKGCSYIYAPAGQAGEYATLATNPYRGCGHACAYCFVPNVLRMDRKEFDSGATPRPGFLDNLRKDARKYQTAGIHSQVMLSFTTDPFNGTCQVLTRPAIEILKDHGLAFCTLTKGGSRAVPYLDLFRPTRDAFASTLTSLDDQFSLRWEPRAALPKDRMNTLKRFHEAGIFTWVSLEPVLDVAATLQIINETHPYVDFFKIGRINYSGLTKTIDWKDFTLKVIELCARLDVKHYLKLDLQPFMPAGYDNQRHIEQHH